MKVSAITSEQDSLQAFPKNGKRKGEDLFCDHINFMHKNIISHLV